MLEGVTLYSVTLSNSYSGLLLMLSISLHNIPLGFQIGNSIDHKKYSNYLIFILCISALLGALIVIVFGSLNPLVTNILLSLSLGMLLYILIFELFAEMIHSLEKKPTIYGIIIGIVILLITYLVK